MLEQIDINFEDKLNNILNYKKAQKIKPLCKWIMACVVDTTEELVQLDKILPHSVLYTGPIGRKFIVFLLDPDFKTLINLQKIKAKVFIGNKLVFSGDFVSTISVETLIYKEIKMEVVRILRKLEYHLIESFTNSEDYNKLAEISTKFFEVGSQ